MRELTKVESFARNERAASRAHRTAMRGNAGQSLVELALVTPVFMVLVLGAAEFTRLAYAWIEVSNAARAGAAYGAQSIATASDTAGIQNAAANDSPDISRILLPTTSSPFCSCSGAPGTQLDCATASAACSGDQVLTYVQVKTSATWSTLMHYPTIPNSFTLYGQAIMRVGD